MNKIVLLMLLLCVACSETPAISDNTQSKAIDIRVSAVPRIGLFNEFVFLRDGEVNNKKGKGTKVDYRTNDNGDTYTSMWKPDSAEYREAVLSALKNNKEVMDAMSREIPEYFDFLVTNYYFSDPEMIKKQYSHRKLKITFRNQSEFEVQCEFKVGNGAPQGCEKVAHIDNESKTIVITLTFQNKTQISKETITVEVPKNRVWFSLGDSYASGEGNPDVAITHEGNDFSDALASGRLWMDERCHRSIWAGPIGRPKIL